MRDFTVEAERAIEVYLSDPTPNVEIAVRNQILHLAKSGPGDLFALHEKLVEGWGRNPPKWDGEDCRRSLVIGMIARMIDREKLCHMCQGGRFVLVNTVGEGTNMAVRHYLCDNPPCGCYISESVCPA